MWFSRLKNIIVYTADNRIMVIRDKLITTFM